MRAQIYIQGLNGMLHFIALELTKRKALTTKLYVLHRPVTLKHPIQTAVVSGTVILQ